MSRGPQVLTVFGKRPQTMKGREPLPLRCLTTPTVSIMYDFGSMRNDIENLSNLAKENSLSSLNSLVFSPTVVDGNQNDRQL